MNFHWFHEILWNSHEVVWNVQNGVQRQAPQRHGHVHPQMWGSYWTEQAVQNQMQNANMGLNSTVKGHQNDVGIQAPGTGQMITQMQMFFNFAEKQKTQKSENSQYNCNKSNCSAWGCPIFPLGTMWTSPRPAPDRPSQPPRFLRIPLWHLCLSLDRSTFWKDPTS